MPPKPSSHSLDRSKEQTILRKLTKLANQHFTRAGLVDGLTPESPVVPFLRFEFQRQNPDLWANFLSMTQRQARGPYKGLEKRDTFFIRLFEQILAYEPGTLANVLSGCWRDWQPDWKPEPKPDTPSQRCLP